MNTYIKHIESICQYLNSKFTSYHELVPEKGEYILIFELEMTLIVDLIKI